MHLITKEPIEKTTKKNYYVFYEYRLMAFVKVLLKDEAMKSAIVGTENIISFSYNPQKKWIEKDDLANQISLKVVNDCGWSFGLIGREGVNYFKSYFLEIYEKTTPDKNFSR